MRHQKESRATNTSDDWNAFNWHIIISTCEHGQQISDPVHKRRRVEGEEEDKLLHSALSLYPGDL